MQEAFRANTKVRFGNDWGSISRDKKSQTTFAFENSIRSEEDLDEIVAVGCLKIKLSGLITESVESFDKWMLAQQNKVKRFNVGDTISVNNKFRSNGKGSVILQEKQEDVPKEGWECQAYALKHLCQGHKNKRYCFTKEKKKTENVQDVQDEEDEDSFMREVRESKEEARRCKHSNGEARDFMDRKGRGGTCEKCYAFSCPRRRTTGFPGGRKAPPATKTVVFVGKHGRGDSLYLENQGKIPR